ncbi:hypothetical protein [Alkalitalea saponilacus]|uniref:Membrane domain of glycerophosphoryl diester phosphodiesterase n=1 Tax=Alkalitalea saponilacus TaxID=889453 RepID=A0A1T5A3G8_9BACT|nr:hypothetical protein [Alkalitalea saponilacus]ASB48871.1 hypothetical protein CDL62_06850 [Alkalitalea saponilacus]SKB29498.1 hypothetical protein SAMN03080601_00067 [Alkalitalea saponilacus]
MKNTEIQINRKRDFSEVINATFTFLKQEFKPLGKVIIWYAGIPIIITSIIGAYYSGNELSRFFQALEGGIVDSNALVNPWLLTLLVLVSFATSIFLTGLSASYIKHYVYKGKDQFSSADVWNGFVPFIGPLIGLYFISFIIIMVTAAIGGIFVFGLSSLTSSTIITAIIIFMGIIALVVIPVVFVFVPLSMTYMPLVDENIGAFSAIKRSFSLVFGNWWVTFGIIVIASVIVSLLGTIFSIPAFVVGVVQGYSSVTGEGAIDSTSLAVIFTTSIGTLAQYIIYPIVFVAIAIQYYSLKEQKENPGLLQKIEEITDDSNMS